MNTAKGVPIKLGIMIGSETDLLQCEKGMMLIREAERAGKVSLVVFAVNSIHRNTLDVLGNLEDFTSIYCVQRWIMAAGMANHLTATGDAILRYILESQVPVFGAVFEAVEEPEVNLQTAILSITQAPGNQVVFNPKHPFFADACALAINMETVVVEPRPPKEVKIYFSTDDVLAAIDRLKK